MLRTRSWIALVLVAAAVAVLASDLARVQDPFEPFGRPMSDRWWGFYPIERTGDDFALVISTFPRHPERRARYLALSVGEAVREVTGGEAPSALRAPADLEALRILLPDGRTDAPLCDQLLDVNAGRLVREAYDPVVPTAAVEAWTAAGVLTEFPLGVALVAPTGGTESAFGLFVDGARTRLLVVPDSRLAEIERERAREGGAP